MTFWLLYFTCEEGEKVWLAVHEIRSQVEAASFLLEKAEARDIGIGEFELNFKFGQ